MDRSGLLTFSACLELAEPSRIGSFSIARPLAQKAKKQVDANVADCVERGCIKLGTAAGYAEIDNGREDHLDSATQINTGLMDGDNPRNKEILSKLGLNLPKNTRGAVIHNTTFIFRAPPAWIFCMSELGCEHDAKPENPKENFIVEDLQALAEHIMNKHNDIMADYLIGKVSYNKRVYNTGDDFEKNGDYFVKQPHFASEEEIRIVWLPREGVKVTDLILEPDPIVASLMRRL